MRMTDAGVKALKPGAERYEVWEDGRTGFGVRVTPRGTKTFMLMYRFAGKARRLTLGVYPAMGLSAARLAAAQARDQLDHGIDPGVGVVEQRQVERTTPTVQQLVELYLEQWAKPNKRTWREDERLLNKDVVPILGSRKASDIRRRDVRELVAAIAKRGAPIAANRTLAAVRKMFAWALADEVPGIDVNPAAGIAPPGTEVPRDRVLSADELKALWRGLDGAGMRPVVRLAIRFLLVTLARRGEVASMAWADVDTESGIWTIPAPVAKNGIAHRVPLTSLALDLLCQAKALKAGAVGGEQPASPFVFPSPRGDGAVTGSAISHALRRTAGDMGLADVTPHDLRRSGASHMASVGVPRLVIGKVLNHVEAGITAVYDRHGYDREKRQALEAWETRLQAVVATSPG